MSLPSDKSPEKSSEKPSEKIGVVFLGHVDHGKSTLIGRLLYDTGSFMDGKFDEIKAACERRKVPFEWSFLLDAFQAERDQAITIDTTQIWFKSQKRPYMIIDAPGHREFLKNMISGASFADVAVLVVDAHEGLQEQTKRHAYLLHLLGLHRVLVVINKMDKVDYKESVFIDVRQQISAYLKETGVTPHAVIPIAASLGDNVARSSTSMPWYKGETLLATLDQLTPRVRLQGQALRFPVQDVYRYDNQRIIVGRVESGTLRQGDTLRFLPSDRSAKVVSLETWNTPTKPVSAEAGQSIGIVIDQPAFVMRGDVACHDKDAPVLTHLIPATIFWLSKTPLKVGAQYKIKIATREAMVSVQSINRVIHTDDLSSSTKATVDALDMAEVTFRSRELLALDSFKDQSVLGRIVLLDNYDVVGGGIIRLDGIIDQRSLLNRKSENIYAVDHLLTKEARTNKNGHKGAVIWLTGLSGSGKSTLAMRVEYALSLKGIQTYVLDGDNVRRGLCSDLGFAEEDRTENIRRVGEVATLMADAGLVIMTAFISPFSSDRQRARAIAGDIFHEVYIKANLAICEQRDPKGLYKKARKGEIAHFTGISSPYEAPQSPELVVDTSGASIDECVEMILAYILGHIGRRAQ